MFIHAHRHQQPRHHRGQHHRHQRPTTTWTRQASQDRFLKLLVAQLNNQDPLNPMDNAQMTTQMAQINTVSGIQELNATLKGMADAVRVHAVRCKAPR